MTAQKTPGRIDVISDAICPWCYIGKRHMDAALAHLATQGQRFAVYWHPFQLNPDMPAGGADRRDYRTAKFGSWERSLELDEQITKAGAVVGLKFRTDLMRRTPNTIDAHRTIWLAGQHGVQDAVMEALFRGYFTEGADIGDHATLTSLAVGAGLPVSAIAAMLAGDDGRAEVMREVEIARGSGINGVPCFTMANHVLFSGAVPADVMAEAFEKAWAVLGNQAA